MLRTIFFLLLCAPYFVNSATFENVTLLLTTSSEKLFINGQPPLAKIFVKSSDTISDQLNLQPFEFVVIQNENVPELSKGAASNLYNIVYLSVQSSKVKSIQPGAFDNAPKLDILSLAKNELEEIKNGVFTNLLLKTLYLDDNKISRIEDGAFNNMTLTQIWLDNNRLSTWNYKWFIGTAIGAIYMTNNLLEEIPGDAFDYIWEFKKINAPLRLWHIDLSQNHIKTIHKDAFKGVNKIEVLNLSKNSLEELPGEIFRTVKSVQNLDLSHNNISTVDEVFGNINIQQLVLTDNKLTCFPTSVFEMSTIISVFMDANPVTCRCAQEWNDLHLKSNVLVVYNVANLEKNCVIKE